MPPGGDAGRATAVTAQGWQVSALANGQHRPKLCGVGEWLVKKRCAKTRRSWRKLHIGVNADTGQTVAVIPTIRWVDDSAEVGPLLD